MKPETKARQAQLISSSAAGRARVGIVVLAAGASTRMGESKQLLRYEGETLLRRAVNAALASRCRP
ncbi:MAG: NTP transferase domain-containing protein, partial [Pyrinomonadaceae bacterium]|nr:NTP transferase domain-containing protein [Pyrinomonadaceae bacterium]